MLGGLPGAALGAAAALALALAAAQEVAVVPADQEEVLSRADRARAKGDSTAPIRVVEVSDFECPACAQFYRETLPALQRDYIQTGKVQYVWVAFPNPNHLRAWTAIEAGYCAGAAGKFWEMHDLLFDRQLAWIVLPDPPAVFAGYAEEIGIEGESFARCLREDLTAPLQVSDLQNIVRGGIESTPFFVIGDSVAISGAAPFEDIAAAIDTLLVLRGN